MGIKGDKGGSFMSQRLDGRIFTLDNVPIEFYGKGRTGIDKTFIRTRRRMRSHCLIFSGTIKRKGSYLERECTSTCLTPPLEEASLGVFLGKNHCNIL